MKGAGSWVAAFPFCCIYEDICKYYIDLQINFEIISLKENIW